MQMPVLKAWLFATLLTIVATPAFAQTPANKISRDEAREAKQLARRFSQRLQQTKDIAPLIEEYFVSDFLNGYLLDQDENWFLLLERNVATQVSRAQLRRYFIAELNWFYLNMLYSFSKHSSLSVPDLPPEKMLPPDVLALFRSDPAMRATIENEDDKPDEAKLMVGSVERFWNFTQKLETANRLLRKHARRINAGRTSQYRETISDWSVRFHYYEPWLSVCEQKCLALDKGTRLITINVPVLQLELAKVNGRMRIVKAIFYIA